MSFLRNLWAAVTFGYFKSKAPKILVIDDEFDVRNLIKDILETQGYRVQIAADGVQGLARCRAETFDLLILDTRMPRMDGNEFLDALRSIPGSSDQAVIMLSAENMLGPIGKSFELGIREWIPKPFTAKTLLTKVAAQLNASKKP